MRLSYDDYFL